MKEAIEQKILELQKNENPSPFQIVARGSLIGALGQIRNAEDNLRYHDEAEAKKVSARAQAPAPAASTPSTGAAPKSEAPKS